MMETDKSGVTQDSRPAFGRPRCCVGIYLEALEAVPDKEVTVGSHHAFMMTVGDKMLEHFQTLDLSRVKGGLERRRLCDGVVLEGFHNGCVLAVTFEFPKALEDLWSLHISKRLTPALQDILVDKSLLKATSSVKLTLRSSLWEDEYQACKDELANSHGEPVRSLLSNFPKDLEMVQRVKEHQKVVSVLVCEAKDIESQFEHNLGDFLLTVKRVLPDSVAVVRSLHQFGSDMKVARGLQRHDLGAVDQYLEALDFFRKTFTQVEENIVHRLCQVRSLCEKEKQQQLKKTIKDACYEMLTKLKPDADLQKVRYKEWELKVLPREQRLFYGLVSLVPMSLDRLTTIDLCTDEYITEFPEIVPW